MQSGVENAVVPQAYSGLVAAHGEAGGALKTALKTPGELAEIVSRFAASDGWMERVRLRTDGRWYERLYHGPDHDLWVISWLPGQSTGFHDHGASSGAFVVVTGSLEERRPEEPAQAIYGGEGRSFGPDYAHDVGNGSLGPAISIHAYSPPLDEMNEYELDEGRLVPRERAQGRDDGLDEEWRVSRQRPDDRGGRLTIEQMLSAARARLQRLSADEAHEASRKAGAILVDIRPESQRVAEGSIPGALVIERNVLEWRLDPTSSARLAVASDHEVQVILFCSEGYASSLAAASLQDLGLWRATDLVGGFKAWRAAGLPVGDGSIAVD
jgi:rhodanese-related sulfurtransferase